MGGALGYLQLFSQLGLGNRSGQGTSSTSIHFRSSHLVVFKNDPLRDKRPIRDGRLGEIKGQDGFEAMVFGSP